MLNFNTIKGNKRTVKDPVKIRDKFSALYLTKLDAMVIFDYIPSEKYLQKYRAA